MDPAVVKLIRDAQGFERQGQFAQAIACYESGLKRCPQLPNTWYNLAALLRRVGEFEHALAAYQESLDRGVSRPEEVHLNRGVIFTDCLGQTAAAEAEYRRALELNTGYVPAWLNLANLQEDVGLLTEARSAYEKALALDPRCHTALARLANTYISAGSGTFLIARLQAALRLEELSAADRAEIGFALGRLLDANGHYERAFDAYRAANRASRLSAAPRIIEYDRDAAESWVDRLMTVFSAANSAISPARTSGVVGAAPQPIFVCGMFRSGSTLVENLLGRHPRVTVGGELDFLPRIADKFLFPLPEAVSSLQQPQIARLADDYLERLAKRFPGADLVTDKRPDNVMLIGLIKTLFPNAKIVHTCRDPVDNCLSLYFLHLDHRMSYALDLLDTGHHYRQYLRLMTHWKALYGEDIIDVDYDALVRDPAAVAQSCVERLGLDWHADRFAQRNDSAAVKTASVWQVRQPIYPTSSGRAQHYARHLAALKDYLPLHPWQV